MPAGKVMAVDALAGRSKRLRKPEHTRADILYVLYAWIRYRLPCSSVGPCKCLADVSVSEHTVSTLNGALMLLLF